MWTVIWLMLIGFIGLTVTLNMLDNKGKKAHKDWHCKRCLRQHNNERICSLCDAPYGWELEVKDEN